MATTGIIHYLQSSDSITHGVAGVLLAMSVASWCFLIVKAWVLVRAKSQGPGAVQRFWQAPTLAEGIAELRKADKERVYLPLAVAAWRASEAEMPGALIAHVEPGERVLRALRHALLASQRRLELGRFCWHRWGARRRLSVCWAPCGAFITRWAALPRAGRR